MDSKELIEEFSTNKLKLYKLTEDNYKKVFEMWVDNKNRDTIYIYHCSYLNMNELESEAFKLGIRIDVQNYKDSILGYVEFKEEIFDL